MIPILCIEDSLGMLFHNRRVSRDEVLTKKILELAASKKLWIREFSKELFPPDRVEINDNCMELAGEQDFCFLEDVLLTPYMTKISKVILCRWNRRYPSDFKMDLDLRNGLWMRQTVDEIVGKSHERITIEEWVRV